MGKLKSIGGLWAKEKNGKRFFSGSIEIAGQKHTFMVFKNDYKQEGDRAPDYKLMVSDEATQQAAPARDPFDESKVPF